MSDQSPYDINSRRLRREAERRRLLEEQGRDGDAPTGGDRSTDAMPPTAGTEHDAGPGSGGAGRPLSRRELRDREAAASGGVGGGGGDVPPPSSAAQTRASRGVNPAPDESMAARPAPERPLSRRELRERARADSGGTPRPPQDSQPVEAPVPPEARSYGAQAGWTPEPFVAPGQREPEPSGAPVQREPEPSAPLRRRERRASEAPAPEPMEQPQTQSWGPRPSAPVPDHQEAGREREAPPWAPAAEPLPAATPQPETPVEATTPTPTHPTPATPTRASLRERMAHHGDGAPADSSPETTASAAAEEPVAEEGPPRISPQQRAAAIKAQAARAQAEREEAARDHVERLQSQRLASQRSGAEEGQAPAAMWGQRPEAGSAQAGPPGDAAPAEARYQDRPPVRRVVLPPTMVSGASPVDVPVLGQWQGQPGQTQTQPEPLDAGQTQPGQPHETAQGPGAPHGLNGGVHQPPYGQPPDQNAPQAHAGPPAGQPQAQRPAFPGDSAPAGGLPPYGQPLATLTMSSSDRSVAGTEAAQAQPGWPQSGPASPPPTDPAGPLPRWGSVTAGTGPAVGGSGWSPSPTPSNGQPGVSATPAAAPVGTPHHGDDDDDEGARHPYTWLHMIVLVLVAFVLGMLIFMLIKRDAPEAAPDAQGPAEITTSALVQLTERVGD